MLRSCLREALQQEEPNRRPTPRPTASSVMALLVVENPKYFPTQWGSSEAQFPVWNNEGAFDCDQNNKGALISSHSEKLEAGSLCLD